VPPDGSDRAGPANGPGDIYVEFSRVGNAVKVAAIDAETGAEAFVIGPLTASRADLQSLAVAKLRRQMTGQGRDTSDANRPVTVTRRGIIV
jgi:hypothetical protein